MCNSCGMDSARSNRRASYPTPLWGTRKNQLQVEYTTTYCGCQASPDSHRRLVQEQGHRGSKRQRAGGGRRTGSKHLRGSRCQRQYLQGSLDRHTMRARPTVRSRSRRKRRTALKASSNSAETGAVKEIKSKDALLAGEAFSKSHSAAYDTGRQTHASNSVKYDLIGKLVEETGLTRKALVTILAGIEKPVFEQFKNNPEEFILKAGALIDDERATAIIRHITYNVLDESYGTDIFTEPTMNERLSTNAMKTRRRSVCYSTVQCSQGKRGCGFTGGGTPAQSRRRRCRSFGRRRRTPCRGRSPRRRPGPPGPGW